MFFSSSNHSVLVAVKSAIRQIYNRQRCNFFKKFKIPAKNGWNLFFFLIQFLENQMLTK